MIMYVVFVIVENNSTLVFTFTFNNNTAILTDSYQSSNFQTVTNHNTYCFKYINHMLLIYTHV